MYSSILVRNEDLNHRYSKTNRQISKIYSTYFIKQCLFYSFCCQLRICTECSQIVIFNLKNKFTL